MTIHKKISSLIGDLLADNEIESAIYYSRNYVKSLQENSTTSDLKLNELCKVITHLSHEFNEFSDRKIKGTVTREETDLHRKNITDKLLTFLDWLGSLESTNVEKKVVNKFLAEISAITQSTPSKGVNQVPLKKHIKLLNFLMALIIICSILFLIETRKPAGEDPKPEYSINPLADSITIHRDLGKISSYYVKTILDLPNPDSISDLCKPTLNSIFNSIDTIALASRIEGTSLSHRLNKSMLLEYNLAIDNEGGFTILSKSVNGSLVHESLELPQPDKDYLRAVQEEIKKTKIIPAYHRELQSFMFSYATLTVIIIAM
ncbi:MAG: hypothetical protein AAGC85_00305 [Bacteroidota bacterium]